MNSDLAIVKIGGSLEPLEPHGNRLKDFFDQIPCSKIVVVVGGGKRVDQIRKKSKAENWSDSHAHWEAIKEMATSSVIASYHLSMPVITQFGWLTRMEEGRVIFDCYHWLKTRSSEFGEALPESWNVTSDSIALLLATDLKAAKLILLKSTEVANDQPIGMLSQQGIIDRHFPELWRKRNLELELEIVNFRSESS